MPSATFKPFEDFRQRAMTQLFGISSEFKMSNIDTWLNEIESPDKIEYFFVYIEVGVDAEPITDRIQERFPNKDVHTIINVPPDEMQKILEFCLEYHRKFGAVQYTTA